jgi:hypothetical protein
VLDESDGANDSTRLCLMRTVGMLPAPQLVGGSGYRPRSSKFERDMVGGNRIECREVKETYSSLDSKNGLRNFWALTGR